MKKEIQDLIQKYVNKHTALLQVYSDSKLSENELQLIRDEMKTVLEIIDDLKKLIQQS